MRRGDQRAVLGRLREHLLALRLGGLVVAVERDRHGRVVELHRGHVDQVAGDDHPRALALDDVARVAPRVARRGPAAHARHDLRVGGDRLQAARGLVRAERVHRGREAVLRIGWCLGHLGLAQIVVDVALAGMHHGLGKHRHALVRQAAHVIAVHVGDEDVVDLVGPVAGRLQVGQQRAGGRAAVAAGARVDQDQPAAGVDEERVDRGLHGQALEMPGERGARPGRGLLEQLIHRQVEAAVVQCGHLEVAEAHPVEARRLRLHHRGGGLHGRDGQRREGDDGDQRGGTRHGVHGGGAGLRHAGILSSGVRPHVGRLACARSRLTRARARVGSLPRA